MDHYDRINDYEHYIMIVCYCGFRKKNIFYYVWKLKITSMNSFVNVYVHYALIRTRKCFLYNIDLIFVKLTSL